MNLQLLFLAEDATAPSGQTFLEDLWNALKSFFSLKNIAHYGLCIVFTILLVILCHFLIKFINFLVMKSLSSAKKVSKDMEKKGIKPRGSINYSVIYFIQAVVRVVIYTIMFFFILGIFGADFTAFGTILAGAVAGISLSLQDVISAFAYGIIILSVREYSIGDYIIIPDGPEGTVRLINLLTTTLVTYDGRSVYIPNNVIGKGAVINTSTEPTRRVTVDFKVPTDTSLEEVRKIVITAAVKDTRVMTDPYPVIVVNGFADDSVSFSLRVYCKNEDYWDVLFQMYETILTKLQEAGIKLGRGNINIDVSSDEGRAKLVNKQNLIDKL